ncbi:hypothetical protein D3C81_1580640 [compost metagenome]
MHALGVTQHQPGAGGGAYIGAELAGYGAGAGLGAVADDVGRAVDGDELAVAGPGRAFDAYRALDRRQRRGWLDQVRGLAYRADFDPVLAGLFVVALDRPTQAAGLLVIGVSIDHQRGQGRCRCGGNGGQRQQKGCQQGRDAHGQRFPQSAVVVIAQAQKACSVAVDSRISLCDSAACLSESGRYSPAVLPAGK